MGLSHSETMKHMGRRAIFSRCCRVLLACPILWTDAKMREAESAVVLASFMTEITKLWPEVEAGIETVLEKRESNKKYEWKNVSIGEMCRESQGKRKQETVLRSC